MTGHPGPVERILRILGALPGVHRAVLLSDAERRRAVELEERHEMSSVIPIRNLGVRNLGERDTCFALLKDTTFRSPKVPTVFLVEEDAPDDSPHALAVDGRRYAVVGEEVVEGTPGHREPTIPLERSFVIFPARRSGPRVSCLFVLPPVRFPELEREAPRLGISDVVSISPSLAADGLLRDALGFPPTNDLATLLIGCNWAPPGRR
jgi:hypothetical protein